MTGKRSRLQNRAQRATQALAVVVLVLIGVDLPGAVRAQGPDPDPTQAPIPQFDFDDPAKSIVVRLDFNGPVSVSLVSAKVVFGRAQTNIAKPPVLHVQLFDHSDNRVDEFTEWSPLRLENYDTQPSVEELPQAVGIFSFPFLPNLRAMTVTDIGLSQELIEVDLVPAILDFCEQHPTEPECAVDLAIVSFEAVDPPTEILVGEPTDITLRKVITNNGPLGIMDTQLTTKTTASAGATVAPAQLVLNEAELVLDELREVEEVFTVECQGFSSHTFTFTNQIDPLNPVFIDPNPANDQAQVVLEIECVVPVAINIKPHSNPNSINPRSSVPVAVLTTQAGEYGTPLDFDATTINPTSVRFGPGQVVFAETAGATEFHGRGHVQDSFELDEVTKDGDRDMVLHFRTSQSGLLPGDTEACLKGQWHDALGQMHKFFGCDAVRFVP